MEQEKINAQEAPTKYEKAFLDSMVETNDAAVAAAVEKIVAEHMAENDNKEVYEFLLNCVDLSP
ncbi:MAG: deoxyribose-phosphate aldolase, partial [Bacteroidales bacterium]|nr:deoxyribose-phosphate aldolase [Bacteroidales bacterium]